MILITGGARSGKSGLAERMAARHGERVLYIATSLVTDDEMADRIAHHRASRPATWSTHEGFTGLGEVLRTQGAQHDAIMLECITTLMTNLMFAHAGDTPPEQMDFAAIETYIEQQIDALMQAAADCPAPLYLVTNEVGFGIVPEHLLARRFRDIAGRINQRLAANATEVWLVISGIDMKIKGVS
ncbi:bifunctional adenosylcobinamide kinase/adenosylcobinamide-phosphate guanylyltransferase [Aeromonas sp. MdU4]|uniref:bifunctional adenosylcobinamide kinase/adenosylcobinamide-phosphate guanylyltransferase n=1 Tax=Aeromonas sp. MdU4 TaxID=3342819 RepID=UPI0035B6C9C8